LLLAPPAAESSSCRSLPLDVNSGLRLGLVYFGSASRLSGWQLADLLEIFLGDLFEFEAKSAVEGPPWPSIVVEVDD
jgi:hypothetical protein